MTTGTTVALCTKGSQGTTWLEVGYDGLAPPLDLFDDLAMIGWRPPAPVPPPRDAIDWSRPDEATGQRFTVRPYRIEGARVDPPPGSGPRHQWTADERRAFEQTLIGVLARHGLALDGHGAAPPPRPATAPAATSAPPATTAGLPPPPTTAVPAVAAGLPPPPAPAAPAAPPPPPARSGAADGLDPDGFYQVIAVVPRGADRSAITAHLDPDALALDWVKVEQVVDRRYRGSVVAEPLVVPAVSVLVPGSRADAVLAGLVELHLVADAEGAVVRRVSGDELADALRAAPAAASPNRPWPPGAARVAVVVDPKRAHRVEADLIAAGALEVRTARVPRVVEQRYRGSTTTVRVPGVRIEAAVPAPAVAAMAQLAATAGDVPLADVEQVPAADDEGPSPPSGDDDLDAPPAARTEPAEPAGPADVATDAGRAA
ncbi:MAG: hypothetical protein U0Q07_09470 [Acidimicrobiales bacterium]